MPSLQNKQKDMPFQQGYAPQRSSFQSNQRYGGNQRQGQNFSQRQDFPQRQDFSQRRNPPFQNRNFEQRAAPNNRGPPQRRDESQLACGYNPCRFTRCPRTHLEGQQQLQQQGEQARPQAPTSQVDGRERMRKFGDANRCKFDHDGKNCTNPACRRLHGKCAQTYQQCETIPNGICEPFFSQQGCTKNHSIRR